jgi:tRNA-dihydrouridine synthase B
MKLFLAPLHGVTNRVYRGAYFRHFGGFDSTFAPFILAVPVSRLKPNHFKDLLPGPAEEAREGMKNNPPLVPQLLGNEALAFAETARLLADLGYDEINWNLGCPYPMVVKKERGSGLLPFPDRIGKVLESACAVPGIRVSVKLRLGRSDPGDILRLMPILNDYPLARVIIHPRVGTQMYRGKADIEGFARAAELCRHELVYNGDIFDRTGFETLRSRFPRVDQWMIGRGLISNPFLPEEIRGLPAPGDRAARLRAWHDDLYRSYREVLSGPAHVLDKMKEVWTYLGASFPHRRGELQVVAHAKTLEAYEAAVAAILGRGAKSSSRPERRSLAFKIRDDRV